MYWARTGILRLLRGHILDHTADSKQGVGTFTLSSHLPLAPADTNQDFPLFWIILFETVLHKQRLIWAGNTDIVFNTKFHSHHLLGMEKVNLQLHRKSASLMSEPPAKETMITCLPAKTEEPTANTADITSRQLDLHATNATKSSDTKRGHEKQHGHPSFPPNVFGIKTVPHVGVWGVPKQQKPHQRHTLPQSVTDKNMGSKYFKMLK